LSIANQFLTTQLNDDNEVIKASSPPPRNNHPSYYDIAVPVGHIAKLNVPRKSFRLGEEIIACLKFREDSKVKCVQYSVSLVSEEELFKTDRNEKRVLARKSQTKVTKSQDFTIGFEESSFALEVPLFATPTFSASLCTLNWRLHFQFVVFGNGLKDAMVVPEDDFSEWNAPQRLNIQTLEWNLPITIYSADPVQVECLKPGKSQPYSIFINR
jgi:hypothetical protein